MSSRRYPEEFKIEAVKQVTDRGHRVAEVAGRLGMTTHSLYAWVKKYGPDSAEHQAKADEQAKIRRLKKELKRVTEESDILKKAAVYFASQSELGTPLLKATVATGQFDSFVGCWTYIPAFYYAWNKQPPQSGLRPMKG